MKPVEIHFEISLKNNLAHVYRVHCTIKNPRSSKVTFSLPSWTPGSYLIRDFSQHVISVSANSAIEKISKDAWICSEVKGDLILDYDVYAFDPSVRAAFLDDSYAFFTGTSVFMRVHEHEDVTHFLTIEKAPFESKVATSMTRVSTDDNGFGSYSCANYDELVDHPVMICDFGLLTFQAKGVPHQIAYFPRLEFDEARLISNCTQICEEQIKLFGEPAPFSSYLFLLKIEESGYGGLEHRASSALICKVADLPRKHQTKMSEDYRALLGLFSHEYFHAWNVKRIKPKPFLNYNFNQENYTELLWFFEGFTSYYDDLMLRRSGVIDTNSYLDLLGKATSRVYAESGRFKQTLSDASFDSWIKFYKPNENSQNTHVSYYLKGSLVGLALDLTIRKASSNKHSLDDVMKSIWQKHGKTGLTEQNIKEEASEAAGVDLSEFFATYVHATTDLPLEKLLASFGIELTWSEAQVSQLPYLGCSFKREGDACVIGSVAVGTPAMEAGLCAGDVIIAIDDLRVQASTLDARLRQYAPQSRIKLHIFRKGWLRQLDLTLAQAPKTKCTLALKEQPSTAELAALEAWLYYHPQSRLINSARDAGAARGGATTTRE